MINVIERYHGSTRVCGALDCLTMLLESIGDTSVLETVKGRYKTIKGGLRRLPEITGFKSIDEYLTSKGYEEIPLVLAFDSDLVINDGSHCFIYHTGSLFGVHDNDEFGFKKIDVLKADESIKVYRAPK